MSTTSSFKSITFESIQDIFVIDTFGHHVHVDHAFLIFKLVIKKASSSLMTRQGRSHAFHVEA